MHLKNQHVRPIRWNDPKAISFLSEISVTSLQMESRFPMEIMKYMNISNITKCEKQTDPSIVHTQLLVIIFDSFIKAGRAAGSTGWGREISARQASCFDSGL